MFKTVWQIQTLQLGKRQNSNRDKNIKSYFYQKRPFWDVFLYKIIDKKMILAYYNQELRIGKELKKE